jgi:hypothetical protein
LTDRGATQLPDARADSADDRRSTLQEPQSSRAVRY